MTQIVGINGFKRTGKGETANALSYLSEGVVYQVGFADKLKIMAARALGFDRPPRDLIELMDSMKETALFRVGYHESPAPGDWTEHELTGREYLQRFGTEARKLFGTDFWVNQVLPLPMHGVAARAGHGMSTWYPDVDILAITDLRFENEAQRIKDLGGVVWEVIRPGTESDGHASEQVLPRELIDYQITNDAGLDSLEVAVAEAMRETL